MKISECLDLEALHDRGVGYAAFIARLAMCGNSSIRFDSCMYLFLYLLTGFFVHGGTCVYYSKRDGSAPTMTSLLTNRSLPTLLISLL